MADPISAILGALGGAVVVGPSVAFFIKAQGKRAIAHGAAEQAGAEATKIEAETDAKVQSVLIEQLRRAEQRFEAAKAEAAEKDKALTSAREETGQHAAQIEQVKRTYDERLRTVERLSALQSHEIDQCRDDREKCAKDLAAVEARLSERLNSLTPQAFPAVKPEKP